MYKISIKQVKRISLVAAFLLCSVVAIAQPSTVYANESTSSSIGVVNYNLLIQKHPDIVQAQATMNATMAEAKKDFDAKSADKSDAEKQALSQKTQKDIQEKQHELLVAINSKVEAAVKEVADAKGLTMVMDKSTVIYGGQDITDDVMKKITAK